MSRFHGAEKFVQQVDCIGELFLPDDERRREEDEVAAKRKRNVGIQSVSYEVYESRVRVRPFAEWLASLPISNELDHRKQTVAAAHIADNRVTCLESLQACEQLLAERSRSCDQIFAFIRFQRS